jgi:hypothetical protein
MGISVILSTESRPRRADRASGSDEETEKGKGNEQSDLVERR